MAERRMFAKKITESDAFLDMPSSTQMLYFHLSMNADDDGFVNNPKKIQRMCWASDDDFKLLIAKSFVILFESGVIVIKHWKMHNYIQSDRYRPTDYVEEKSMLGLKKNKAYTLDENKMDTRCIQDVSVGKVSKGKDSIGKDSIGKDKDIEIELEEVERVTSKHIVNLYHTICVSYPKVKTLSDARKKAINARLKCYSIDDFKTLFEKAEASDFLKGSNDRDWSANFDWLIKDANMAKIIDGNYDNKDKLHAGSSKKDSPASKNRFNNFTPRQYDCDSLEGMLLHKNSQEKGDTYNA